MDAQWLDAIGSIIGGVGTIIAAMVAYDQLKNLNKSLKQSVLASVIQLESDLNERAHRCQEAARQLESLIGAADTKPDEVRIAYDYLLGCKESWFNAADRLAFCILRKYVKEREWKDEYIPYFHKLIECNESTFKDGTQFTNIIKLARKWKILSSPPPSRHRRET